MRVFSEVPIRGVLQFSTTVATALSLFAAAALPSNLNAQTATAESLKDKVSSTVSKTIDAANVSATVGVYVADARSGEVLCNYNGERALKPASNNKLLTTGAGLSLLGPDHQFTTYVMADGKFDGEILKGDLVVYGGGDPTISGRFNPNDKKDITWTMRSWAQQLKKRGLKKVTGDVVADDSCFERDYFHNGWAASERGEWYSAEISGLSFNDNCLDLSWSAKGKLPGQVANLRINPETDYATVINEVQVVAKGRPVERYYNREDGSNKIRATGTIAVDSTAEDSASISNGGLYFVSVFKDVLTGEGIKVEGKIRLVDEKQVQALHQRAGVFIAHKSPPLSEIIKVINLKSQNMYADSLLKSIGQEQKTGASFEGGSRATEAFWNAAGIYTNGFDMVDGSGLSANNEVSPRQLVEVLSYMDKGKFRKEWRDSLPVGGTIGSLKSRFQQNAESKKVAPQISGKTGLISGVRALSGIIKTTSGREVYYSIILNDLKSSGNQGIELLDKIAVGIAKL